VEINGKKISKIAIGLSQFNNTLYTKPKVKFSKKEISKIILKAIDKKINFFDTADNYGQTEKIIGSLKNSVKDKMIISTKAGFIKNCLRNFNSKYLENKIEESLKRLKVNYLDIFFLNKPNSSELKNNNLLNFFYKIKKRGLVSKCGIIVGNDNIENAYIKEPLIECYSFLFNLMNVDMESTFILAKKYNKINFLRSPFNSGLLTNNFNFNINYPVDDYRYSYFKGTNFIKKKIKINLLLNYLKIKNSSLSHAAFSFVYRNIYIDSIFFGLHNTGHLEELNLYSKNLFSFDRSMKLIKNKIKKLDKLYPTINQG
jgi:myo-inositol catabolism protein IolS